MTVRNCIRCNTLNPSDDMTPDAFGDSTALMCNACMFELKTDNSRYLLVETHNYYGTTFVIKQELQYLLNSYGEENIKIVS